MAIIMDEVLADGTELHYHRVAQAAITLDVPIVTFVLESFASAADRATPSVVPYRREFDFPFFGGDIIAECYRALLANPDWAAGTSDEPGTDAGDTMAKPSGTARWDNDAGAWRDQDWVYESPDIVAAAKLEELSRLLANSQLAAIYSGGQHWVCDSAAQARLMRTCFLVAQAAVPAAITRPWLRDDRGPGADPADPTIGTAVTLDGTELLQLLSDVEARQTVAVEHHEEKRAAVLAAYAITPAEDAIAAIKAVTWEFDGYTWGMP